MSGSGLHRHGKRKARKLHWGRPTHLERLAQSARDRGISKLIPQNQIIAKAAAKPPVDLGTQEKPVIEHRGFLKKLYRRSKV